MDYYEYPDYINHLLDEIKPYMATCAEEDRGDGFKEGTPSYISDFRDMVDKFNKTFHSSDRMWME